MGWWIFRGIMVAVIGGLMYLADGSGGDELDDSFYYEACPVEG